MRNISRPRHPFESLGQRAQEDWTERASCRSHDPDLFYPDGGGDKHPSVLAAIEVCNDCPVIAHCARRALDGGEIHGVWAGIPMTVRGAGRVDRYERLTTLAKQVA
jgi:WhiB family redox-sensing transcriptional regulator